MPATCRSSHHFPESTDLTPIRPPRTVGSGASNVVARRLIPLVEWPQVHPWPRLGGLRHLVRHKRTNGFADVVRLVGGRLLIDEAAFFAWADGRQRPEHDAAAVTPEAGAG